MPFDSVYVLYGIIFLGALFLVEGLYFLLVGNREQDKANRRMSMLASGQDPNEIFASLRRKPMKKMHALGPLAVPIFWYEELLTKAGAKMSVGRYLTVLAAASVVVTAVSIVILYNSLLPRAFATTVGCVFIGIMLGWILPTLILMRMRTKRLAAFGEQLPDTLDTIVRSLHAGHPISAALQLVTTEMPDPVGTEFGIAVDEMTYGQELNQALENMAERIGHDDFEYVIVAINIQNETGGNLAEVLGNLSSVIRDRQRLVMKVKALSSEGRMSAWVLSVLPVLTLLGLTLTAPQYYAQVMDDPAFWPFAGLAMGLMTLGIFVMWKMVNFRV